MTATPMIRHLLPMLACLSFAAAAQAQTSQQPLTGQMLGGATPAPATPPLHSEPVTTVDLTAAPAAAPAAAPGVPSASATDLGGVHTRPEPSQIGDTTRSLFRLQASGQVAGARLPILGDQATASYARYLKSFQYDIPQFFETDVAKSAGSSRSGR